jgi:addiction module HigA family antidote
MDGTSRILALRVQKAYKKWDNRNYTWYIRGKYCWRISKADGVEPKQADRGYRRSSSEVNEIVLGKRSISADTSLLLARYFGNSPQFWLGLQRDYDLDIATTALGGRLEREVQVSTMAREAPAPYRPSIRCSSW